MAVEFLLILALIFGLALLAVPLSARLPDEGIVAWAKSALSSFRQPVERPGAPVEVHIDDLFAEADEGTGYIDPEQLRSRVVQAREDLVRKGGLAAVLEPGTRLHAAPRS